MKIKLSGIEIETKDIVELSKNRFLYNLEMKNVRKAKYVAMFKNGSALEINKHEYKLIKKRLGDKNEGKMQ